ncbi:MAG: glycosyltransferase family 2 protein [Thermodesulfovibrionia bacterium]
MNNDIPLVQIIVLNYNNFKDTIDCLNSLADLTYPNYKVLIIDNASEDDSVKRIHKWLIEQERDFQILGEDSLFNIKTLPDFILVIKNKNTGYAGGNNTGIRLAIKNGARYVWILNNDTTVHPDALTELVKVAERQPMIGIVGSKIYFFDNPDRIWFSSGYYVTDKRCDITEMVEKDVMVISGCSFLIKKELIDDIGFLWEGYFLYFEENDYCMRARRNGWKVYFSPLSKVYHKVSRSVGENSPMFLYYKARNYMLYTLRNDMEPLWLSFLFTVKEYLLPSLINIRLNHLKYLFKAYKDFLKIYLTRGYR